MSTSKGTFLALGKVLEDFVTHQEMPHSMPNSMVPHSMLAEDRLE
jgi:hypothetical protein